MPIKSVDLQLVRVETCGCAEGYARDGELDPLVDFLSSSFLFLIATEIQNIQIGDGDICRGISIPIYMVFPRLFSCPTLVTSNFKIGKKKARASFDKLTHHIFCRIRS